MKGNAEHQPAIYHHGRVAGYFSPIILACAALAFVEFMRLLTEGEALESPGLMLVFGAATVLVVWLAKIWYDWTKQAILCTEQGLVLLNDRKCRYRLIPWEELATACELRDEKRIFPFW